MIFRNPVYEKEIRITFRSLRNFITLLVFNVILAFVGLLVLNNMIQGMKTDNMMKYSLMLQVYIVIASLEFLLILCMLPAKTASAISGEREHHTLDFLLSTKLSNTKIIMGKLQASLGYIFLLVISSLPVLSLVFVVGGIEIQDLVYMIALQFLLSIHIGAASLFFSVWFKRLTSSFTGAYIYLILIVIGTLLLHFAPQIIGEQGTYYYIARRGVLAWYDIPLLLNPGVTFYVMLNQQAGSRNAIYTFITGDYYYGGNVILENWVLISLAIQLAVAFLFIIGAIRGMRRRR